MEISSLCQRHQTAQSSITETCNSKGALALGGLHGRTNTTVCWTAFHSDQLKDAGFPAGWYKGPSRIPKWGAPFLLQLECNQGLSSFFLGRGLNRQQFFADCRNLRDPWGIVFLHLIAVKFKKASTHFWLSTSLYRIWRYTKIWRYLLNAC